MGGVNPQPGLIIQFGHRRAHSCNQRGALGDVDISLW